MMPVISTGTIKQEIIDQDWIVFLFESDSKQYFRYSEGDKSVTQVRFVADDSKKGWHWESKQVLNLRGEWKNITVHVVDSQINILQLLRKLTKSLRYCEAVYGADWPEKSAIREDIRTSAEYLARMLPDWEEAD